MLTVKSFQEDPRGVLALLKNYASLNGDSPAAALHKQGEDRLSATRRVLQLLKRRRFMALLPWPHEGTALAIVLRWTQGAVALRERARLKQSLLYSRCRRILLRIGEELVTRGFLSQQEDIFFLTHQELSALVSGYTMLPDAVRAMVRIRREEHARLGELTPPDSFILPEGVYLTAEQVRADSGGPQEGDSAAGRYGQGTLGGKGRAGGGSG